VREKSLEFYRWICAITDKEAAMGRLAATFINVNDRCNMECPDCYHRPNNTAPDYSVDEIMRVAKMVTKPYIAMLGAEPTMRHDLASLIPAMAKETGKLVGIFTNGLKLASREYVDGLAKAGLDYACLSLHLPDYTTAKHHELKLKALDNVVGSGIKLGHVAFCVNKLADIGRALDASFSVPMTDNTYFRIRAPGRIGNDPGCGFSLSDIVVEFFNCLKERGLHGEVQKGSHPYMLIVQVNGRNYFLLRWPSIEELDLEEIKLCTARGLLVPELGETPLMHHVHVWAQRRLAHA
jgi:organic radical activating enzyme